MTTKYVTYVTVVALVEADDGQAAIAELGRELEGHGFVPYDGHEAQSAFPSEHQDAQPDFGGPTVAYYSIRLLERDQTIGAFRSPDAARAWARRHPERITGAFDVATYYAPPDMSYSEDVS